MKEERSGATTSTATGPKAFARLARMLARLVSALRLPTFGLGLLVVIGMVMVAAGTLLLTVASIEAPVYLAIRLRDDKLPSSAIENGEMNTFILNVVRVVTPIVFASSVVLLGRLVAKHMPRGTIRASGIGGGLVSSALFLGYVGLWHSGVLLTEVLTFVVLGAAGGYLACAWEIRYRNGKEAIEASVQRFEAAATRTAGTKDLAAQLGDSLSAEHVGAVMLWIEDYETQGSRQQEADATSDYKSFVEFRLESAWIDPSVLRFGGAADDRSEEVLWRSRHPMGLGELPKLLHLGRKRNFVVYASELPKNTREIWSERDLKGALILPLELPGLVPLGMIMIATRSKKQLWRWDNFGVWSQYLSIAKFSALTIENDRVVRKHARQEERLRIARDVHDRLSGPVSAISINLDGLSDQARRRAKDPHQFYLTERELQRLDAARDAAEESTDELRRSIRALKPKILEEKPLSQAIKVAVFQELTGTGIEGSIQVDGTESQLPEQIETIIYYVAKEAVNNVRVHSGATFVVVKLSYSNSDVMVDVYDNGYGFDSAACRNSGATTHIGLDSMRSRVTGTGGEFEIESGPGGPTVITARFSLYL